MDELRRQGMMVAVAAGMSAILLFCLMLLNVWGFASSDTGPTYWTVRSVPMMFYVAAIVAIALAGRQVARGREFGSVLPRLISAVGLLLAAGSLFEVFGVAFLMRVFAVEGFKSIGFFDPSYVALGSVGLLLWLLGRMMRRASAVARELGEFI